MKCDGTGNSFLVIWGKRKEKKKKRKKERKQKHFFFIFNFFNFFFYIISISVINTLLIWFGATCIIVDSCFAGEHSVVNGDKHVFPHKKQKQVTVASHLFSII